MTDHAIDPNPYTPPTTALAADHAGPSSNGRSAGKGALLLLGAAVVIFGVTLVFVNELGEQGRLVLAWLGFGSASVLAGVGALTGIVSLVLGARSAAPPTVRFRVATVLGVIGNAAMVCLGAMAAWLTTATFSRGRQLRSFGRVLLPRVRNGGDWTKLPLRIALEVEGSIRSAVAAQWRENGRTEHASVAAFARLTLDLMALGAPPALVSAANRDALDEIRHTELCFSLARAFDGKSESPGPFPEARSARTLPATRTLALAGLAVDSLVDGALHEGISARVIARLARRCEDPQIRAVLKEIAADEGRHAAHGWDVVAWCLAEGGSAVAHALAGAISALPHALRTPLPEAAEAGGWERFGIVGRALEADELTKTRADLVRRVEAMIGAGQSAAA